MKEIQETESGKKNLRPTSPSPESLELLNKGGEGMTGIPRFVYFFAIAIFIFIPATLLLLNPEQRLLGLITIMLGFASLAFATILLSQWLSRRKQAEAKEASKEAAAITSASSENVHNSPQPKQSEVNFSQRENNNELRCTGDDKRDLTFLLNKSGLVEFPQDQHAFVMNCEEKSSRHYGSKDNFCILYVNELFKLEKRPVIHCACEQLKQVYEHNADIIQCLEGIQLRRGLGLVKD